jgi:hypothetical protein
MMKMALFRHFAIKKDQNPLVFVQTEFARILDITGGTAWESNPPDLARRSQAVLQTVL